MISNDPDHHSQSIHKLWTRVIEQGRNTLGGSPSALSKTSSVTEAAPLPHTQTPERPLPPPRSLIKKKVRLALKGPRTQGHLRHKPPPTLGSPHQNKTSWYHLNQSVSNQPPDLPQIKKPVKMQCMDTPNRKMVMLISGISLLLLKAAGAAAFTR